MSSTRFGGVGNRATSSAKAPAVGRINGTMARANLTQAGLSGARWPRPMEPPLLTKEAGSSRNSVVISGEQRKWTMLPIQAGDVVVRNVCVEGVRLYALSFFCRKL